MEQMQMIEPVITTLHLVIGGLFALILGSYGLAWKLYVYVRDEAQTSKDRIWEAINKIKDNELHDHEKRIMDLEARMDASDS